jgi:hypothetical protein
LSDVDALLGALLTTWLQRRGYPLDKYLLKMCNKQRLIELMHDFILFDGGQKKVPRKPLRLGQTIFADPKGNRTAAACRIDAASACYDCPPGDIACETS